MLKGLLVLLLFQGIGEATSHYSGLPIPGPVIGMILLFIYLQLSRSELSIGLGDAAHFMIRWLSLLFVPACVGFFFLIKIPNKQWVAVAGVIVISTLVTMIITAFLMKYLMAKSKRFKPKAEQ